jgi:hypothetical protein
VSAGWVLVQTRDGAAPVVADVLAEMSGVEQAELTAGAYDVVARVADAGERVPSAKRVVQAALRVPGVTLAVCCHEGAVEDSGLPVAEEPLDLTDAPQGGFATL